MSNENVLLFLYEKLFPTVSTQPSQVALSHSQPEGRSSSKIKNFQVRSSQSKERYRIKIFKPIRRALRWISKKEKAVQEPSTRMQSIIDPLNLLEVPFNQRQTLRKLVVSMQDLLNNTTSKEISWKQLQVGWGNPFSQTQLGSQVGMWLAASRITSRTLMWTYRLPSHQQEVLVWALQRCLPIKASGRQLNKPLEVRKKELMFWTCTLTTSNEASSLTYD